jgi:hypothetical protein
MRSERLIKVEKQRLIDTVTENRAEHRGQFLEAQQVYRERVIEELDKRLREVRNGSPITLGFRLPEPVDYTRYYDEALAGLDWEVEDQVYLSQDEFNRLVLNNWEWKQNFAATSLSYLSDDE